MKKAKIKVFPHEKTIEARLGATFLSMAGAERIAIPTRCGGKGTCGLCKAKIVSETPLQPPSRSELRLLSEHELSAGFRLTCQCKVTGDASLTIPETPLQRVIREKLQKSME